MMIGWQNREPSESWRPIRERVAMMCVVCSVPLYFYRITGVRGSCQPPCDTSSTDVKGRTMVSEPSITIWPRCHHTRSWFPWWLSGGQPEDGGGSVISHSERWRSNHLFQKKNGDLSGGGSLHQLVWWSHHSHRRWRSDEVNHELRTRHRCWTHRSHWLGASVTSIPTGRVQCCYHRALMPEVTTHSGGVETKNTQSDQDLLSGVVDVDGDGGRSLGSPFLYSYRITHLEVPVKGVQVGRYNP